jgi:hypothetical protein
MIQLIEKNYYLHKSAQDAYRSYLLAYASHSHKDIFNAHNIDLQALAKAFGLQVPPRVNHLPFSVKGDKSKSKGLLTMNNNQTNEDLSGVQVNIIERTSDNDRRSKKRGLDNDEESGNKGKKQHVYKTSGHVFSADNPYGKRADNDKRQFVR